MTALLTLPGRQPIEVTLPDHGTVTTQMIPGIGPVQFARTTAQDALGRAIFTVQVPEPTTLLETLWNGGDLAELEGVSTGLGQVAFDQAGDRSTWSQEPSTMKLSRWSLSPVPWDRYRADHQRQAYGRKG